MTKRTVGVMTMYRDNYGAFLQAYALQKTLNSLEYDAELIHYDNRREKTILGIPLADCKKTRYFIKRLLVEVVMHKKHMRRSEIFRESIEKNLIVSKKEYHSNAALESDPPQYDIYLSGSDQVFNPNLEPQSFEARMLSFTNGYKVSYAASAGNIDGIGDKKEPLLDRLRSFQKISVREEETRKYLEQHLGSAVSRNIDPTLLLGAHEWRQFGKKPEYLKGKYIFYYRVLVQPELHDIAEAISKELGIPVFAADGNAKFSNQVQRQEFLSPEEWVGALADAEYVVTNSFHGVAFSINLKRKVRVVLPPSNTTRIRDMIQKSGLERLYEDRILQDDELKPLYGASEDFLLAERTRALSYLENL